MLYKTLDDVKSSAGFIAISNNTAGLAMIKEDLLAFEQEVKLKYLGTVQFEALEILFETDAIVPDSIEEQLLFHTRRYISPRALSDGIAKVNVNFGKSGITSPKSQTAVPAREWMLDKLQRQLLDSACKQLDILLRFLDTNRLAFPYWNADASVNTVNRKFFLASLPDFEEKYSLGGSFITFMSLWPVMGHIHDMHLKKVLSAAFYNEIYTEWLIDTVSAENQTLLDDYIYRLLAYRTIERACSTVPLQVAHDGIVTSEFIASYESNTQRAKAEAQAVLSLKTNMKMDADQVMNDMICYLNENATAIVYPTWFASDLYKDPTDDENTIDKNASQTGWYTP